MGDKEAEQKAEPGKLTADQIAVAQKWIAEKGPDWRCPVCERHQWILADHSVRLQVQGHALGGLGYPVLPIICGVCGNTFLFNMVVMGLEPSLDEQQKGGANA